MSSGPASGKRPLGSNAAGRRRSRSPRAAIRSLGGARARRFGEDLAGVFGVDRAPPSTDRPRASPARADDSARARSQRAWTMTLVGQHDDAPAAAEIRLHRRRRARRRSLPRRATHRRGLRRGPGGVRRGFRRARCASAAAGPRPVCEGDRAAPRRHDQEQARRPRHRRVPGDLQVALECAEWPIAGDARRQAEHRPAPPARLAREALDHDAERWPRRDWSPSAPGPRTSARTASATAPNQSG